MFGRKQSGVSVQGKYRASRLRSFQNDLLKAGVVNLPDVNSVINLGAVPEDKDKEGDLYSNYFRGKEYYTLDKNRSVEAANHFNLDLHEVDSVGRTFDLILIMSVLEHVENPFVVAKNIQSLLNSGGHVFVSTPFFYPVHKDISNGYSDYWRFTDDALRLLFADMREVWMREGPSVITGIADRPLYWDNPATTVSGYCALFRKVG